MTSADAQTMTPDVRGSDYAALSRQIKLAGLPDVGAGALVFTEGQMRASGPVARAFYRYQAWTFFPLLLLGVHLAGYLALVLLVLPPGKAAVFVVVHQALLGLYLGCSFAPNHKGIEHHLFPSMPRGHLRTAQPVVEAFCAAHRIAYLQTGLVASYAQALRHLDAVGRGTTR